MPLSPDTTVTTEPVSAPVITKGAQGTSGFTVQNMKDAGRNQTNFFMVTPIITTATDTLQSLTGYKSGAAVTATLTPAVVSVGKTFRLVSMSITYVAVATAGSVKFSLRANTSGVVVIGSPIVLNWIIGAAAAVAGVSENAQISFPDGLEFAAGTGLGISMIGLGATQVAAAVGYGQISFHGFEY
jgi:hypothetical protein